MGVHWIGASNFELWNGESPQFHEQSVETFSRNGADGTAAKLRGSRGRAFTSELTSWFASYTLARAAVPKYKNLIGSTPQRVVFNSHDFYALYKTKFLVLAVEELDCHAAVRLLARGINYPSGGVLVTRWTMIPIRDVQP